MKQLFNTLLLFALGTMASFADNKVTIPDFSIIPGEEKQIEIHLDNSDPITDLQFDVTFPEGIEYAGKWNKIFDRITRRSHSVIVARQGNSNKYRIGVLAPAQLPIPAIKGNSGAFMTIKVKAAKDFIKTSDIVIDNVLGVDATKDPSESHEMPDQKTKVSVNVGQFGSDNDEITLSDKPTLINITFDNTMEFCGMQADIALPKGVSFVDGADGEWVTYTDRLPEGLSAYIALMPQCDDDYRLLIAGLGNPTFVGNTGALFGINVVADNNYEGGDIKFSNIILSDVRGNSFKAEPFVIKCKNISTGINQIETIGTNFADGIYNIVGVKSDKLKTCINIVVKNGKAVKVVKQK